MPMLTKPSSIPLLFAPAWSDIEQNLDALRMQLARRVALFLIATCGVAMWLCIPLSPFPLAPFLLFALLFLQAWVVIRTIQTHPALGRYLLVLCLSLALVAGLILLDEPYLPFAGVLLIFTCAVLVRHSEIAAVALLVTVVIVLTWSGTRDYPVNELVVTLLCAGVVAWLLVGTLYTALEWESMSRQRSDQLLSEIREHRAQLSQNVKSLNQAYDLQRRTQQELVWARNAAEEARRSKERFAANISHELRTPLNLVLGFSEVMYKTPEVYGEILWPTKLRRDVSQIYRNSRHLIEMIDDILDLSRVDIASFSLNTEATPLTPLIADVVEIAADMFRGHSARLVVAVEPDLPTLELDRTRIRQVLLNLLNNARRFTEVGSVRLAVRQTPQEIIMEVSDTGIGVPPEKLPHLFDEFYQVDSSLRRSRSGAGLGLTISKRFVEAHGGRIWVDSVQGQGTSFYVALPTRAARTHRPAPLLSANTRPVILVVDSAPYVADWLTRSLQRFEMIAVPNIDELHVQLERVAPRAVLWNTTGMPLAPDVTDILKAPLIAFSVGQDAGVQADRAPVARLPKPISSDQLLREIESYGDIRQILVVDDDVGFTQLIQRMVEAGGLPVVVQQAFNGLEGLEMMRQMPPDLVLLDVVMPDLNGHQVLEIMTEDPALKSLPVLLLTEEMLMLAGPHVDGPVTLHNVDQWHLSELLQLLKAITLALPSGRRL
jgi:signal transduction histidine kinase/CheY-like chemotaxis protein